MEKDDSMHSIDCFVLEKGAWCLFLFAAFSPAEMPISIGAAQLSHLISRI
jgi:hypothetical protein